MPFEGLVPASDADHAQWVVEAMAGEEGVALVVPEGFEAYARLLHPLDEGQLWSTVAPDYLLAAESYEYPFPEPVSWVEGDMGTDLVDALVPVLTAATATPQNCHYALWTGWGALHAVATVGSLLGDRLRRRGPQWWWPADQSWFVGTEIDFPWTYLAGPAALVDAVVSDPTVEAVRVQPSDRW